jgi:MATE family multidrug resistance protein
VRRELGATARLAVPVILTQIGAIAMGTVDTIMVGRLGAAPLAAVAVGNGLSLVVIVLGMGTLFGLDPIVAQAYGAGRERDCGRAMRHGLVLAALLTVPMTLLLLLSRRLMVATGQPAPVVEAGTAYVHGIIPGVLPFLVFTVFRQFLQGIGRVRPAMWIMIGANGVNFLGNWILIYGHAGAPALGAAGAAWATTLSRLAMAAALAVYVLAHADLRRYSVVAPRGALDRALIERIARLGFPVGMQLAMELGVFAASSLLMGRLGTLALAGHQIALNVCSITFMVPLGLSATAAVRVGHALGRDDVAGARRAALACWLLGVGFMACSALCVGTFRTDLARLYTQEVDLVSMGASLLLIGAVFQIPDGGQTVGIGALRGAADTRGPMWITIIGYWLVALPASYALAFRFGLGAPGVWWGLTAGLAFVAVSLALRFHRRVRPERLAALRAA